MKANGIDYIEKQTAKPAMSERRNFLKIGGAALRRRVGLSHRNGSARRR